MNILQVIGLIYVVLWLYNIYWMWKLFWVHRNTTGPIKAYAYVVIVLSCICIALLLPAIVEKIFSFAKGSAPRLEKFTDRKPAVPGGKK